MNPEPVDGERLQKVLAQRGFGSRRVCEELIEQGRVTVNGEPAQLGRRVDVQRDAVAVDGVAVGVRPDLVYYLLHKPYNVITTVKDTHDRVTVVELVPSEPRVFPVGRLDLDSEGLIILTNDGELTHHLTHPSFGVEKEYLVHVRCGPDGVPETALNKLRRGVELDDGITSPAKVGQVQPGVLRIVIHEGRHRQVRRMCDAVGHEVNRLVRTRIGTLVDATLKPGEWRLLTTQEVRSLAVR
ncbi:MAG: pseudouridine synthase [Actinomycetota bacterium]|nr:pseudouridine synthase [Actinomycetota bacterium]MDP4641602.1 rRNA pseudouridine synthase [Ilumatobacteraceae bacterium]